MFTTPYTFEFDGGYIELAIEIDQDEHGFYVWDLKTDSGEPLPVFMDSAKIKELIERDLNNPVSKVHGLCIDHFGFADDAAPLRRDYHANLGVAAQ